MKLIAKVAFSWAHRGVDVVHYEAGEEIITEDRDLIDVSMAEGWTTDDESAPVTMTAAQMKSALTELGVEFRSNASKAELQALLDAAQ